LNLFEDLTWRGLVFDVSEGAAEVLAKEKITAYIGFDPTASSLHVGSLLQIMILVRLQQHGHTPIALVGGGTGMIGDPSGKSEERNLLSPEQLAINLAGIRAQLARWLEFDSGENRAQLVDNAEWLGALTMMDFLRQVGKHFSVSQMLNRESVRRRIESTEGISYTEFSYMLLQSYDFVMLHDRFGCTFQLGGSDQWGNILSGMDLVRRLSGGKAHGLVVPLITTSSGAKFGKTEAGTVWLDPALTSPYRFYQYWINTEDRDAINYLKYFTLLDQPAIGELEAALAADPGKREAQKRLAEEVTRFVHGDAALQKALAATRVLFGGEIEGLSADEVADIFSDVPSSQMPRESFADYGISAVELLATSGVASSKGEARRLLAGGGVYLNNVRLDEGQAMVPLSQAIEGKYLVLRKGARAYHLIEIKD
jgi:tyrosyl-tRNA synthetase